MIDTIKLRLHGSHQPKKGALNRLKTERFGLSHALIPEHFELYKKMLEFKGDSFTIQKTKHKEVKSKKGENKNDFIIKNTSNQLDEHLLFMKTMTFIDEGKVKERNLSAKGKYRVDSSETNVVFNINIEGGFIDFEFSIPKYIYNHNMAQFIPQKGSKFYQQNQGNFNNWDVQTHYLFHRLNFFLDKFFIDLYSFFNIEAHPDFNYLELMRLDLCYNQYFKSKEDALLYLEEQKKIHKKRTSVKTKISSNYKTSVEYIASDGSYYKIYHKGSEYINQKHGDFSKHQAINKAYLSKMSKYTSNAIFQENKNVIYEMFRREVMEKDGVKFTDEEKLKLRPVVANMEYDLPFDVIFLKNEMDKILRYEISLKGASLSRPYKNNVFRNNCKIHREAKKNYNAVKRVLNSTKNRTIKIPRYRMQSYKKMHDFLNRGCSIVFADNSQVKRHCKTGVLDYNNLSNEYRITKPYENLNLGTVLERKDIGVFNQQFLGLLVKKLKNFVDYYQVEALEPYDNLVKRVKLFNEISENNLQKYNKLNEWKIKDINGKKRIYKGRVINKASSLLTESQKRKKHLHKINVANIIEIFRLMTEKQMSISQIKDYLGMPKQVFDRRKRALKDLQISEQNISMVKPIKVKTDFSTYYFKTGGYDYQQKFYVKPILYRHY